MWIGNVGLDRLLNKVGDNMESVTIKEKVTVLMPVYNGALYLREAIDSILNQSYSDFEFLIINDGSIDKSVEIINSYHDTRINLVSNEINKGLIYSLNRGLEIACGKYIARMDCDDISMPDRLAKQVDLMENSPEIGVCGSWIEYFVGCQSLLKLPITDKKIRRTMIFRNPMAHPTVMMRSSVLKKNKLYYDPSYHYVEDYELWTRLAHYTQFYNIPEALLKYRIHSEQVSTQNATKQKKMLKKIRTKLIWSLLFQRKTW